MSFDALYAELRRRGELAEGAAPPPQDAEESIWVLGLQIVGGWLAALFLLSFFGLIATSFVRAGGWLSIGLALTGLAAVGLQRIRGTLGRQFLWAVSLTGQGAVLLGLGKFISDERAAALAFAGFEFVLAALVTWPAHRFLAVVAGICALQAGLIRHDAGLVVTLCWALACQAYAGEARWRAALRSSAWGTPAAALACFCLGAVVFQLAGDVLTQEFERHALGSALGLSLVSLLCLSWQGRVLWRGVEGAIALLLIAAIAALCWRAPGLLVGVSAFVLGYARGHRWLVWLGAAVALAGIGRYYYDLRLDLLSKSLAIATGGGLVLLLRFLLLRRSAS